ncbi:MAG: LemA family protein [Bacteroidetes bacterium]|nr:LemA family protein [Bacteroidota bacterium]
MKSKGAIIGFSILGIFSVLILWAVGSYNSLVTLNESTISAWSQVQNQYQRRADLVPNLVETVKGFAKQEKSTFESVVSARSKATQITVSSDMLNNPEAFKKFENAQSELSSSLGRLLAISENYPNLKSNENFLALQSQLEGTENRISIERRRFNDLIQKYNTKIKTFPSSLIASYGGFAVKNYFEASPGSEVVPKIQF